MLQRYCWKDGSFPENDLKACVNIIQKSKFVKDTQIKRLTQVNGAENSLKEEKDEYK